MYANLDELQILFAHTISYCDKYKHTSDTPSYLATAVVKYIYFIAASGTN